MLSSIRYALRVLYKAPSFTLIAIFSLAIGIGANTAIFSVVDALLLRPLPYPQPERLVNIWLHSPALGIFRDWPSPGQYIDIRTQNHSFETMAIAKLRSMTLTGREAPVQLDGMYTSSTIFPMLGAQPLLGRVLRPDEDKPGKPAVAILSNRLWRRLFSSDPRMVGRSITLDGKQYTVAGVLGREFRLDSEAMPAEYSMEKVDVFLPLPLGADAEQNRRDENYNLMARLKPGVSIQQAQADIDIIASRIREKDKRDRTFGMTVTGLQEQVVGDVRRALLVLLGSVALVLLIACANVANLMLTRASGRQKELAIRTALGAGGLQIVRQLLTESVLIAAMGGAAGLMIAEGALYAVRTINPGNIPRLEDIGINGAVLAFTFGVSLVTGVLCGIAPAWRTLKVDLNTSLKSGGRSGQSDGGMRIGRHRLRGLLVVSELAFSLILLTGAGLLIRSFIRLQAVPPGFATDHILSMRVVASGPKYQDDGAIDRLFREIEGRVAHLPGVRSEGLTSVLPLTGDVGWGGIGVEGYTPPPGQELQVDLRITSSDYFRTMNVRLVKGRFFSEHDSAGAPPMAIVDEKFARRFWPNDNPVGKHLWFDPKKPFTIAGVVGVVKQYGLDNEGKIAVYFPHRQQLSNDMYVVARTSADPAGLAGGITREIHAVDPDVVVYDVRTMQDRLYDSLARQRFASTMLGAFAGFALLLAAVGVFGVMSWLVSQTTHDMGVRLALGAQPGDIVGLVVRQGMALAVIGIAAGLLGAMLVTRVMTSLLFGVSATDELTFGAVSMMLAPVAFAATAIPALRAARVDPMTALRVE
jgi:predicted permease